jgi:hypothetical protein
MKFYLVKSASEVNAILYDGVTRYTPPDGCTLLNEQEFAAWRIENPEPPKPPDQLAASVRGQRNRLLAETDWTQAVDVPQSTKDKWAPYRQALRDVPQQADFPFAVSWPDQPV